MSEKTVRSMDLLSVVDQAIQKEINRDPSGTMQKVFDYYDSKEKPLTNREFFQFWISLSEEEKTDYFLRFFF